MFAQNNSQKRLSCMWSIHIVVNSTTESNNAKTVTCLCNILSCVNSKAPKRRRVEENMSAEARHSVTWGILIHITTWSLFIFLYLKLVQSLSVLISWSQNHQHPYNYSRERPPPTTWQHPSEILTWRYQQTKIDHRNSRNDPVKLGAEKSPCLLWQSMAAV